MKSDPDRRYFLTAWEIAHAIAMGAVYAAMLVVSGFVMFWLVVNALPIAAWMLG